jgi:hypothetical protein
VQLLLLLCSHSIHEVHRVGVIAVQARLHQGRGSHAKVADEAAAAGIGHQSLPRGVTRYCTELLAGDVLTPDVCNHDLVCGQVQVLLRVNHTPHLLQMYRQRTRRYLHDRRTSEKSVRDQMRERTACMTRCVRGQRA